jgi:two-component system, OmpR family, response regulator VanR
MTTQNILIVDDNPEILEVLEIHLKEAGYNVYKASDGKKAIGILKLTDIHLIIMDIMMPKLDGIKATLNIREENNTPIILLSAKSQEQDKIEGLEVGADDYITKPFSTSEVLARVKAQLRRFTKLNTDTTSQKEIVIRGLVINLKSKIVHVNDDLIKLTPKEYKILCLLAKNKGIILSLEMIYEAVWQQPFLCSESTVMFHISKLRKKIELDPKKPMYLNVVWGQGYRID